MFVFLDESLRKHSRSGVTFGVLSGVAIPEDTYHTFQRDFYHLCRPYYGKAMEAEGEIKGSKILSKMTFRILEKEGFCYRWNLCMEALQFARSKKLTVFGVVCFREGLSSFICGSDNNLEPTYRYLFERVDLYMKRHFPTKFAKLIFDNRDHSAHECNSRAITNFFTRHTVGLGYDSIIRMPMFAVSQGHNYGLQLADLITTVIGLRFQGENRARPLWNIVYDMLAMEKIGSTVQSSLKVMKDRRGIGDISAKKKDSAARKPMTEP
jgi:hypothetical protein